MKKLLPILIIAVACNKQDKDVSSSAKANLEVCYEILPARPAPERKPPAPVLQNVFANLKANVNGNTASLTWSQIAGAKSYAVHRSLVSGFIPNNSTRLGKTQGLQYTNSGLQLGVTYYYRITALKPNNQEFAVSEQAQATTVLPPVTPKGQKTVFINFEGGTVDELWWNPYNNGMPFYCAPANITPEAKQEIVDSVKTKVHRAMIEAGVDPSLLLITTTKADYDNADPNAKAQIMVTPTNFYGLVGGVAFVGSFYNAGAKTCFVFSEQLYNHTRYIFEAAAHELGHCFGLYHHTHCENGVFISNWHPGHIMGLNYVEEGTSKYCMGTKFGCDLPINDIDSIGRVMRL